MNKLLIFRVCKKIRCVLSEQQKHKIILLAILMVIGGLLETFSVSLIIPFMDAVMEPERIMSIEKIRMLCDLLNIKDARSFLMIFSFALAMIFVLKNVFLIFQMNIQYKFVFDNMFAMQERLLDNFIHRPYEFFLKINSAEIMRVIQADTSSTFELLIVLLMLFSETIVSLMLVGAVFVIAPYVTLMVAGVLLVLVFVINVILNPIFRRAGKATQESTTGMNKWLLQSIQGIKEIKVTGKEKFFQDNYSKYGNRYINAVRKNRILALTPKFLIEATMMSAMFVIIGIMIMSGSDFTKMIPLLSAVAMAAVRLLPSVNRITNSISEIAYEEPMLDKLIENLVDIDSKYIASVKKYEKKLEIHSLKDSILFNNITYIYPDSFEPVLDDAFFEIRSGESVGIIGASGAGKTTAVDIIMGLLKPQSGQVCIDGINVCDDLHGWVSQIGYIPQMIFMLDDSIRVNVAFGVDEKDISDEEVWRALREASLDAFVKNLPEGLDTRIGERGVRLSGGQRQRIGIARALYLDPKVLILDEATSALDNETESAIMESINSLQGKKTMIIIAHRLSTIENCDHVYKVEQKCIIKER